MPTPREIYEQRLRAAGIPEHVIAGVGMNVQDESGWNPTINEIQPLVPGSRGGYGFNQWTGPRRTAYESRYGVSNDPLVEAQNQADYTLWEWQGPEKAAFERMMATSTPEEAAAATARYYLRPAPENLNRRVANYTGGRGGFGTSAPGGAGVGNGITMSTKGAPAMEPFVERQSLIRQLIGGEGLQGKLAGIVSPLEGANPRLEQERFSGKARRLAEIAALQGSQMAGARGPISPLQVLAGALASGGETVMTGAAEKAGATRDTQLQEMLASGNLSPEVLARITALDPEYGQTLTREEQARQQRMTEMQMQNDFTLSRDQAQREHEAAMAALEPTERTAMERQLIAAGYDPNGPVGEDGLNDFQREMRRQLEPNSGGAAGDVSISFDANGNPIVTRSGTPTQAAGGTDAGTTAGGVDGVTGVGKIDPGMAQGTTPDGQIVQAPIPGSKEDVERQRVAEAAQNAENQELKTANDVLSAIDQVKELSGFWSTGFVGKVARDLGIGGSPAYDIDVALRPVIANMGFDRLQQMRAANPNGAALGQVTERENTLLQSTIKSLDPNASKELFNENLEYVRQQYDAIVNVNPNDPASVANYERVMGFPLEQRNAPVAPTAPSAATPTTPSPAAPAPAVATPTPAAPVPQTQPTGAQRPPGAENLPSVASQAEFDALPSGSMFWDAEDGVARRKP